MVYAEAATDHLIDQTFEVADPAHPHGFVAAEARIRTAVYQAQGMVMVDLGVSLAEALARLRATAFAEAVSLDELAADIVSGQRRLHRDGSPDGGPGPPPCT